jgi:hypothetical protein
MLKRKSYNIRNALKRRRAMWARETLSDDNPNPPMHLTGVPMTLLQNLVMELRKSEVILVSILIDF